MTVTANTIVFRDDVSVALIDYMGSDEAICQAARVSTQGADSYGTGEAEGLINYLARDRHGSPFEHVVFKWLISAPIFVWREIMRHRIASYNEESARYKQLEPVFYKPGPNRKLVQVGKAANYELHPGNPTQKSVVDKWITVESVNSYNSYMDLLEAGVAREVARMVLPVNIYSSAYVTMNLRGLMNFLSLRNGTKEGIFPTHPLYEISLVAEEMEESVADIVPLAMKAFQTYGRVTP